MKRHTCIICNKKRNENLMKIADIETRYYHHHHKKIHYWQCQSICSKSDISKMSELPGKLDVKI